MKQEIKNTELRKQVATRFYIGGILKADSEAKAPAVQFTAAERIPFDVGRVVCEWITYTPIDEIKDTLNGMSVLKSTLFDGESMGIFGKSQDHFDDTNDQYGSTQTWSGAEITYQNAKKINGTFGFSVYDADIGGGLSYQRQGTVIAMVKFYEF